MWTPQVFTDILSQLGTIIGAITVIVKLIEANKQQTTTHAQFASKALDIANEPSTTNVTNPAPEPLIAATSVWNHLPTASEITPTSNPTTIS